MKRSALLLSILFVGFLPAQSQTRPIETKLSPHLRLLASGKPDDADFARRLLHIVGPPAYAEPMVDAFIQVQGEPSDLARYGVVVRSVVNHMATVFIPTSRLQAVTADPSVIRIEESRPVALTSDVSVPLTGANALWGSTQRPLPPALWTGTTGKNAVVAIVDSGIDLNHPDFRDSSGNTRIKYLWDQTATNGTPPQGYETKYPTSNECTAQTINALYDNLDLAVANGVDSGFSVLLRNSAGGLGIPEVTPAGKTAAAVASADFNLDGKLDVALGNADGTISIELGNGDGTFKAFTPIPTITGFPVAFVATGDFNGDGKPDLVAVLANSAITNNLAILLGNGDGTFQTPVIYQVSNNANTVAVGDLNLDGMPDLVVTNYYDNTVSILLNEGSGTFGPATNFQVWDPAHEPQPAYPNGQFPTGVAIADFNHDGYPDLVVSDYGRDGLGIADDISILLGNGDGTFQPVTNLGAQHFEMAVAVGDFNGDGYPDIALESYSGFVTIRLGRGDGTFYGPQDSDAGGGAGLYAGLHTMLVGDFDRDGKPDVAMLVTGPGGSGGNESNNVSILLGNGDGTFKPAVLYPTGSGNSQGLAAGNFHSPYCSEVDINGHGTHVAGIAAGNGSAGSNVAANQAPYRYIGMAPQADLIVVKIDVGKANPQNTILMDAVTYISSTAGGLGKPMVINMSFGTGIGPHDGTSLFDAMLDGLTGLGRIIVAAAGNDGAAARHASGKVAAGSTELVNFFAPAGLEAMIFDIWYSGADRLGVNITGPTGPCVSGFLYPGASDTNTTAACGTVNVTASAVSTVNGDHETVIAVQSTGSSTIPFGGWVIGLTGEGCPDGPCVTDGSFDIWALPSCLGVPLTAVCVSFSDHVDSAITVEDPASATQLIAVGSYVSKVKWNSAAGMRTEAGSGPFNSSSPLQPESTVQAIAASSSLGPRRPCRAAFFSFNTDCTATVQKPEIVAPGEEIMSAYASGTPTNQCNDSARPKRCLDADGQHVIDQGTSMSAPHVTGAVALLLDKFELLNPCQVKYLLSFSRVDVNTGAVPNNTWGYGKLAVDLAAAVTPPPLDVVPQTVGMAQAAAEAAISAAGLSSGTVTFAGDATARPGTVIGQSPTAGSCGTAVNLILAGATVPGVLGQSRPAAEAAITAAGLTVGAETHAGSATIPVGAVVSEEPSPGTFAAPGSPVNLALSGIAVPDVAGVSQASAQTSLSNSQLAVGAVTFVSGGSVPAGSVIAENPTAGTYVLSAAPIDLTISGIQVPAVTGMSQSAAQSETTASNLTVGALSQSGSATVPAGEVINEIPVAGSLVGPGTPVELVISTGAGPVTVSNVAGLTQAAASTVIQNAGLAVGAVTTAANAAVPPGGVVSQSPVPGGQVSPGTPVSLVISGGISKVAAPNVVGLTQTAATTAIQNAGLTLGTIASVGNTTVASGTVIGQNPVAGTQAAAGSQVSLIVSLGTQVTVPAVVGVTQVAASSTLQFAGLTVGAVSTVSSGTAPVGTVTGQTPAAGTAVSPGSPVNLVVSSGLPMTPVPNVVGVSQAAASAAIRQAGMIVGTVTAASSSTVAAGNVIAETPAEGTPVLAGTSVNLTVSSGASGAGLVITPKSAALEVGQSQQFVAGELGTSAPAVAISLGDSFSCALMGDGTVQCWGSDSFGQLGNGIQVIDGDQDVPSPAPVLGITTAIGLSAFGDHACAVLSNGTVQCWGLDSQNQLGNNPAYRQLYCPDNPSLRCSPLPAPVDGITIATSISTSPLDFTCAVLSDTTVQCWGDNLLGQLGNPNLGQSVAEPVTDLAGATAVAAGGQHACALTDGTVQCWGDNGFGELGGPTPSFGQSVPANGIGTAVAISAGLHHTCALLAGGTVQCWGRNNAGQLGNGTTDNAANPVPVSGITTATAIAAGFTHTCVLLSNGTVQCFGDNSVGELGIGMDTGPQTCQYGACSSAPVTVQGIANATAIAAGNQHTCAILADGTVRCWGYNQSGQLGTGSDVGPQQCTGGAACSMLPVLANVIAAAVPAAWSSSDTTVATVDRNGLATAIGPGSATITAIAGTVSGSASLGVSSFLQQTLNPAVTLPAGDIVNNAGLREIAAGDFNGDGYADLAVINGVQSYSSWSVWLGDGTGALHKAGTYPLAQLNGSIAVGDFNGDGYPDVITGYSLPNGVGASFLGAVWLGKGDGTFVQNASMPLQGPYAVGDFNRDLIQDLATPGAAILGNSTGTFGNPILLPSLDVGGVTQIAIADFNNDGKPDIVGGTSGANDGEGTAAIAVLLGNGDGSFHELAHYGAGTVNAFNVDSSSGAMIAAGDFNGDGKPDVAVANFVDDAVYIYLGNGDGTLTPVKWTTGALRGFPTGGSPFSLVAADFNGDGFLDLAVSAFYFSPNTGDSDAEPSAVWLLLGNGDGTFKPPVSFRVGTFADSYPWELVTADFNGDGKPDIATANTIDSTISLLLSSGGVPSGAGQVSTPSVVGLAQTAADTAILGARLTAGPVTTAYSSAVAAGIVISQNPAAGAKVNPGAAVKLVISSGPAPAPASLSIAETHAASFGQAQANAVYTVTVSNAANAGPTSGTVTVTETPPAGMTLTSMSGTGWSCPGGGPICTTVNVLLPGASYAPITTIVSVAVDAVSPETNQVNVSGGGSATATYNDVTVITPLSPCDLDHNGLVNLSDLQLAIYESLGEATAVDDLNRNGAVNVVDIQILIGAVLGQSCRVH